MTQETISCFVQKNIASMARKTQPWQNNEIQNRRSYPYYEILIYQ